MARVALQGVVSNHPFQITINSLPVGKESIHCPAPVRNFSLPKKKGGHRGKISVVDMSFLVFIGLLYPYRPEKFSLRPEKFSKMISFSGGSVRFSLL